MRLVIGLVMLWAGIMIVWWGRPAAGGRLAAFVARPGMGVPVSLVMTALVGLGFGFAVSEAFSMID